MRFPCSTTVGCPGTDDNPLTNYSAEDPDAPIRLGYSTGTHPTGFRNVGGGTDPDGNPDQDNAGTGTGGDPPPIGSTWDNPTVTTIIEVIDTDPSIDPDDVAGNQNVVQLVTHSGTPGAGGLRIPPVRQPTRVFVNHPQTCTVACADGTPFSFTVPQGKFKSLSQAEADRAAYSYACKQAQLNMLCMGSFDPNTCSNKIFQRTIPVYTRNAPVFFEIVAGVVPSWLNFSQSVDGTTIILSGTPADVDAGDDCFTIQATDRKGNSISKEFCVNVTVCSSCVISTASPLDAFDQGQTYSKQLAVTGGTAPYVFSLLSGTLPTGLSLSSTGLISGTATLVNGNLDKTFTVKVVDAMSATCSKTLTLPVLDYHSFPPGKKWRIQGYIDGSLDSSCCQVCGLCNVWDGKFSVQSGSAVFTDNGTNGIANHLTVQRLSIQLFGGSEWAITLYCSTIPGNAVWVGTKVGSNAGVKLDSPAGVYTFNNYFGYSTVCDGSLTLTIEEY